MPTVGSLHDYGQRYTMMVVERYFPTISVTEVLEDDFLGIDLVVAVAMFGGYGIECSDKDHRKYHQYVGEAFHVFVLGVWMVIYLYQYMQTLMILLSMSAIPPEIV